jgi:hypothetical protein
VNTSLRAVIRQRRQYALRATRRNEGPNLKNMCLLNVKDGVIPALLQLALQVIIIIMMMILTLTLTLTLNLTLNLTLTLI